jgi:hypothetical protein
MYRYILVISLILAVLLSGCKEDVVEDRTTTVRNSCVFFAETSTNATVSGKIWRCDTPDGFLYVMEGVDMEFAP